MEITIIHGQAHKGSTYNITTMLKEKLIDNRTVVNEYFMLKDAPSFCVGCFQCIKKGEEYCPEAGKVQKIVESMLRSDIVILNSPTYCLDMSGQLKTFFDHLGYMWLSHRPRKEMFSKIGIVISTTAGAGAKRVTKSMAKQLFWWGVPRVYKMSFSVQADSWQGVSDKIKDKIVKSTSDISHKVKGKLGKKNYNFMSRFLFNIMRKMQSSNNWNLTDREYWQRNNWLGDARPWR